MKRFALLLVIVFCIITTGCQQVITREQSEVSATITEVQYKAAYTTSILIYNAALKMSIPTPVQHDAQYLVTITYEDITQTFDSQTLYENSKAGDTIQVILCKYYDEAGNLIEQSLQIP